MLCLEDYCKRDMLIEGFPLEEESEQGVYFGNNSSFLLFLLHNLAYVWYFSTILDISVLHKTATKQLDLKLVRFSWWFEPMTSYIRR